MPPEPGEEGPRVDRADRRTPPEACAQCHEQRTEYVYMENQAHYCIDCAVVLVLTRKTFPAGRRAEDFAIEQLVRDRLRWAARTQAARLPSDQGAEPQAQAS